MSGARQDRSEYKTLPVDRGAALKTFEAHPESRVRLACCACGWSRTYDPTRIVERLQRLKRGDGETLVAAVAHFVQWPCPRCRRMRWRSELAAPYRGPKSR